MFKSSVIIIVLLIFFLFHGCASIESSDGSLKNEEKIEMTKDEMLDEIEELKLENQRLRTRLQTQIDIHNKENQKMRDENKTLATKLAALQHKYDTASTESNESNELKRDIQKIRMKVLSGNGNLNSAKEMAKKLRNMGYKIELIHRAPRSDFLYNTIYSTPKFRNEANRLVSDLGGNTIYKPLTWHSVFDIIVITGNNP